MEIDDLTADVQPKPHALAPDVVMRLVEPLENVRAPVWRDALAVVANR